MSAANARSLSETAVRARLARMLDRDGYRLIRPRARDFNHPGPYWVVDCTTGGIVMEGELPDLAHECGMFTPDDVAAYEVCEALENMDGAS